MLDSLIEKLTMQDSIDVMQKYYSAEAWPAARLYSENWPWRPGVGCTTTFAAHSTPSLNSTPETASHSRSRRDGSSSRRRIRRIWVSDQHFVARGRTDEIGLRRFERDLMSLGRNVRFVAEALWARWDAERVVRERRTWPTYSSQ
jgi:hypothetical protein